MITIHWPNGSQSQVATGTDWLEAARAAGVTIPTGCLGGSCGACEIEVNGEPLRACIATVGPVATVAGGPGGLLRVELASDPYW
jgi:ferredoxin